MYSMKTEVMKKLELVSNCQRSAGTFEEYEELFTHHGRITSNQRMEQILHGAGKYCDTLAAILIRELENSEQIDEAEESVAFLQKLRVSCKQTVTGFSTKVPALIDDA